MAFKRLKSEFYVVLRQKLVIICATLAGVNLRVLGFEISVLLQTLVIICVTEEIQAFY